MSTYIASVEIAVYAEANQFVLYGDGADSDGVDDEPSNAELAEHVAARGGSLTVFTASYGVVSVKVEARQSEPRSEVSEYDHVVDASVDCPAGELLILEDGTEERARVSVPAGTNRVRVGWANVAEGNSVLADEPRERVTIQVWPGEAAPPRVLRWYEDWRPRPAPSSMYGLRVVAGPEINSEGMRAIGDCPHHDGSSTVLIVDAEGVYWEQVYRQEPPYDEILFELPQSELHRFKLDENPGA
jgi:hypothetical protein